MRPEGRGEGGEGREVAARWREEREEERRKLGKRKKKKEENVGLTASCDLEEGRGPLILRGLEGEFGIQPSLGAQLEGLLEIDFLSNLLKFRIGVV